MKKITNAILIIMFTISCIGLSAQTNEIAFNNNSWEWILAEAKTQNSFVFVDAYASWCGPCKWAAKNVFTNKDVANYYNQNFINVSLDMEKGEGLKFAKKFPINSYPTFLIINSKQQIVARLEGVSKNKKFIYDFIEFGKTAQKQHNNTVKPN